MAYMTIDVKFKKLSVAATIPRYTREADACLDLTCDREVTLYPGETDVVPTGLAVQLPPGFEGRVRGRSGLASKGIHVHHGTIDEEYRGEVGIIMTNHTENKFFFKQGDRIAQFSVSPVYKVIALKVQELTDTQRGANGFGSSDKVVA